MDKYFMENGYISLNKVGEELCGCLLYTSHLSEARPFAHKLEERL